jgi:septum formation protein
MLLERVVLASLSPRRLELLRSLGLEVEVRPSGYAEPDDPSKSPAELAVAHARSKAEHVLATLAEPAVLVASDTVVDLDGLALNKPIDAQDAVRMLNALSGREHLVHTGMAIALPGRELLLDCSTTRVRFYQLDPTEIAQYVASGEPMDKAGSYGIQGRAASLVESIDGDFYTVMGFPLSRFVRTLQSYGFTLPIQNKKDNTAG